MSEDFKKDEVPVPPQEEQQLLALVKRLEQQIISLEKKVDTLLARSVQRVNEGRSFSKPFRSFGHSQDQGKPRRREGYGEREFSAGRFGKPRGKEDRGFGQRGKSFYRSDRQQGEEKRGFDKREKPFYRFDKPRGESRRPIQRSKPTFHRKKDRF